MQRDNSSVRAMDTSALAKCGLMYVSAEFKCELTATMRSVTVLSIVVLFACTWNKHVHWGEGIAQWLERRTRDRKVAGSSPGRSGGRTSPGSALCADSYFGIHSNPRVTAVARKGDRSFCQRCWWQAIVKRTWTLRMLVSITK